MAGVLKLFDSDFITTKDIQDILTFKTELDKTYEEREKEERKAADEALAKMDFVLPEELSNQLDPEKWDF